MVRSTTEHGIKKWLKKYKASSILFHHRWPTSTDNVKNACHPFSTKDYFATNYVLVHNGMISNAYELASSHYEMGIKYHSLQDDGTFNDSEALLWDVALYLEGQQDELKAKGEVAFICIATPSDGRKSRHLYFARNSNPLNMLLDESKFIFLSSEGEGEPITPDTLYDYNYRNRSLQTKALTIPRRYAPLTNYAYNPGSWDKDWNSDNYWDGDGYQNPLFKGDIWEDDEDEGTAGSFYGYELFPDSIELTYNKVVEGGFDTSISIDGETVNISAKIRNKVRFYLEETYGLYEEAAELADEDYDSVHGQIEADRKMNFKDDTDLLLERDVIVGAMEVLYSSPYWKGRNAIDPGYETIGTNLVTV